MHSRLSRPAAGATVGHDTRLACSTERLPGVAQSGLGLTAGVLAAMVIAAAADRLPVQPSKPAARAAQAQLAGELPSVQRAVAALQAPGAGGYWQLRFPALEITTKVIV